MCEKYPLVSICIPNYNYEKYLDTCLKSALNQTYPNVEVVLVDNCSTDNSMEIANKYKDNCRVRIYQNNENIGVRNNYAKTYEYAKGKYIAFLCSDDYYSEDFIEKAVAIMENHTETGLVVTAFEPVDKEGKISGEANVFYSCDCVVPKEYQLPVSAVANFINGSQAIMKKELLDKVEGFSSLKSIYFGDWELYFYLSMYADIGYISTPLLYYRIHEENYANNYIKSMVAPLDQYLLMLRILEVAEKNGLTDVLKRREDMLKKVASQSLKTAVKFLIKLPFYQGRSLQKTDIDLIKKYLFIVQGFDLLISETPLFKIVNKHVNEENFAIACCVKDVEQYESNLLPGQKPPYPIPDGYIPIDIDALVAKMHKRMS